MRLIHISDLHFGTEVTAVTEQLLAQIRSISADVAIVSGDFTQIASPDEFARARDFVSALGLPCLFVPGNHDIPRFQFLHRLFDPFRRYRRFIDPQTSFVFTRDQICIAGINTARPFLPHWNWANGAISERQLSWLDTLFAKHHSAFKVVVMHHPVHKAEGNPLKTVVFGGAKALARIKKMNIDLVLTGHVHHASITTMEEDGHKTVFLSASTAVSRRLRDVSNGFNLVTVHENGFLIEVYTQSGNGFEVQQKFEQMRIKRAV